MNDERGQRLLAPLLRALTLLLCGLLVAIVVSPWVYQIAQSVAVLKEYPFRRVFDRVAMVTIIVAMALGWRWMRIRFSYRELLKRRHAVQQYMFWLLVGVVCIVVIVLAQQHAQLRVVRPRLALGILQAALIGLGSAAVVGVLEECIFRGYVLHAIMQHTRRYTAILTTSAVFAVVHLFSLDHFLKSIKNVELDGSQWDAGFRLVALFFKPLGAPGAVLPGLVGLFLLGWLLAELTVRTRTLWAAIGLHTGLVWAIKYTGYLYKYIDPPPPGAGPTWFYGEKYAATGVLGWIVVGGIILVANGMLAYAIYRPVAGIFSLLSHTTVVKIGRWAGRYAYVLGGRHRRVALDNLRHAFPEKTEAEREQIARESFATLCVIMLEMMICGKITREFHAVAKLQGLEHIDAARKAGKAVLFFTGHLASWEVLSLSCGVLKYPFTAVARPIANEWIYGHIARARIRSGVGLLDKHDITRDVLRVLRAKEMVGIVGDQYAGSRGLFVQFFGRPASTSPAMALFARKTEAVIVPAFDHFMPDGTHAAIIYPGFEVAHTDNAERDVFEATQKLMSLLEQEIRRTPGQWLWMHRKWRERKRAATELASMAS